MKNIRDLFDTLSPAPEQTARMAARIDAEAAKNRRRPVRRMAAVLAAALLLAGGTVTAFAVNPDIAETVRQFFTREEILIDGKAQMIGQRDGENGIVLSVDKAFRDGNTVYLSCTLTNTEGVFEGYLLTTEELTFATDYCGVKSGRDTDKWKDTGPTKGKASKVSVPLIMESPVNLECKVVRIDELGSHHMIVADVVAVDVDDAYFDEKDTFHLSKAKPMAYSHGRYYGLGEQLGTFGYSVRKQAAKKKPAKKKSSFK